MSSDFSPRSGKICYAAFGPAIGLVLGGMIGLLLDNLIIFAGGGLILGSAIGGALDDRSKGTISR